MDQRSEESPNVRWILHCAVNDVNWKGAIDLLSRDEVRYCLQKETRKTAIRALKRRARQLMMEM